MDLEQYIAHPELLDRETLFDLRNLVARYPYHQVARLLMLQNLYLLHNPTFDEELRRSALYITDRTTLFNLVEAIHYTTAPRRRDPAPPPTGNDDGDRTGTLIDIFLNSLPPEEENEQQRRKPTPADARLDYMAFLLENEREEQGNSQQSVKEAEVGTPAADAPDSAEDSKNSAFDIIDNFLENEGGKIEVSLDQPEAYDPERDIPLANDEEEVEEDYFTETLAKIYIKQGKYSKAFEIIQRLNLIYPKKSAYFADQMRFLEKIIANEAMKKKTSDTSSNKTTNN